MNLKAKVRLPIPANLIGPDEWIVGKPGSEQKIVVSRDFDGKTLSVASDFVWDLTPYHSRGVTSRLFFTYWQPYNAPLTHIRPDRLTNIRQMQHLMCHIMYSLSGRRVGICRLKGFHLIVRKLALFAENNRKSVFDILSDANNLEQFVSEVKLADTEHLFSLLNHFYITKTNFEVAKFQSFSRLSKKARQYRDTHKQTPPLPTRIYSKFINNLDEELTIIEGYLDDLVDLLNSLEGIYKISRPMIWRNQDITRKLIRKSRVSSLLRRYGSPVNAKGLMGLISKIYLISKFQIHLFSGMRDSEVTHLPFSCMRTEKGIGRTFSLIDGYTTKLNNGRKRKTFWVTTDEGGFRVIRIVQRIARVIYNSIGIDPTPKNSDKFPLFISSRYFPWAGKYQLICNARQPIKPGAQNSRSGSSYSFLVELLVPRIEEEDIRELEDIEPFRGWQNDPSYQIGNIWPIRTHQFRRSLALYARASGIVQLSSLRRQLQHLTNSMTSYYAKGAVFATDLLNDDPECFSMHFAKDWQTAEVEVEAIGFDQEILNSNEVLFGPSGVFYDNQKKSGNVLSREMALQEISRGTFSYTPTPVGGCTKVGPCDKKMGLAVTNVVCVTGNCKNMIGKHSKIIKVIEAKRNFLSNISPDSIEYKLELEELEELQHVEEQWRVKSQHPSINLGGKNV